jgi:hypothetical protein
MSDSAEQHAGTYSFFRTAAQSSLHIRDHLTHIDTICEKENLDKRERNKIPSQHCQILLSLKTLNKSKNTQIVHSNTAPFPRLLQVTDAEEEIHSQRLLQSSFLSYTVS